MADRQAVVMTTLKDLAAREVDSAAESLAAANKLLADARSKLDMLTEYRQDYVARLDNSLTAGLGAEAYQNYHNFLRKLDQAIMGQQDLVASSQRQVSARREVWQECQRKKLSYEVLVERSNQRVHRQEVRQEQKMMDEHAMRMGKFQR